MHDGRIKFDHSCSKILINNTRKLSGEQFRSQRGWKHLPVSDLGSSVRHLPFVEQTVQNRNRSVSIEPIQLLFSRSSLNSDRKPYLRCSCSCHSNWGRQYLQGAIWLQKVVYSAAVKKGALHGSSGIRFQIPTVAGIRSVSLYSIWPTIRTRTDGMGPLHEPRQCLESLLWNRNPMPGCGKQRRGMFLLHTRQQRSKVVTRFGEQLACLCLSNNIPTVNKWCRHVCVYDVTWDPFIRPRWW